MSKITKFFLSLFVPIIIFFSININKTKKNFPVLSQNEKPSKNLTNLLDTLNIKHDGRLQSIVDATQKKWLRKPNQERWEVEDKYQNKRKFITLLFEKLGMIKKVHNSKNKYIYALILGATVTTIKTRIEYLIKKWKEGLRFKNLVFLGGQRSLEQFEKDLLKKSFHIAKTPQTEIDVMRFIFSKTKLPNDMKKINTIFINAKKKLNNNNLIRPTTGDTINEWLKTNPQPGACIAISNQPYVNYQQSVLKTLLPSKFNVETIGEAIKNQEKINISILLDNLARFLYQENKRLKFNKENK